MDVLSSIPRDITHVRYILFDLPIPFSLTRANHELFWPFIDNTYSIRKSRDIGFRKHDQRPAHVYHDVICRFKRAHEVPSAKVHVLARLNAL
jgi:hypothetical protein